MGSSETSSIVEGGPRNVAIRIAAEGGKELTPAHIVVPVETTVDQLQTLCNGLLGNEDPLPMSFRTFEGEEIRSTLIESLPPNRLSSEKALLLIYLPQAVFRVRAVTRCTSSLPGHAEPVINAQFSPDGRGLASGSGDWTLRLWDLQTELPLKTCSGHKDWVLCIAWSPNGMKLASASKDGVICLWNPKSGELIKKLSGHKQWINALAWNPLHEDPQSRLLASAGKDGTIRIWDTVHSSTLRSLTGHTASVTSICWGGVGLLYSCSQDRTIKVWRVEDGVLCRNLSGHSHWINTLALNVSYALRTGCYSPNDACKYPAGDEKAQQVARQRYDRALGGGKEMLVSGSDDFTLFLWRPSEQKDPVARMTGHQQLINQVAFSPDTRIVASASFDKSIKLWCGRTGKFLSTLRGHVLKVYQIAWSSDSCLLVSGSADSTLKVWDVRQRKLMIDLPGHGDEIFTVDWSPDGERVVSGGKDKVLKLWRR